MIFEISVQTLPASSQNIQPAGKITEQMTKSKTKLNRFTVNRLLNIDVKHCVLFSLIEYDSSKYRKAIYSDNL